MLFDKRFKQSVYRLKEDIYIGCDLVAIYYALERCPFNQTETHPTDDTICVWTLDVLLSFSSHELFSSYVEMILEDDSQNRLYDTCYMTPRTLPVAILLLFFFFTKTCQGCSFQYSPISSTFEDNIESVLKSVLLDYPITIVSNLQPDNWCFDIWYLHFIGKELKRLETVSGENMRNKIGTVRREVTFLEECNFNESRLCLAHQQMNISIFFKTMLHTMNNMKYKIKNNFQNCTWISCVSAPVSSVPTEAELYSYEMTTVHPTVLYNKQKDQGKQHNKRVHLFILVPVVFSAFIFLLVGLILQ